VKNAWAVGDRVFDVALPVFVGTVTAVQYDAGMTRMSVNLDAGCASVYAPQELEWYTRKEAKT